MYTYTWKKYLPVIRILLKRSVTGDQQLSLNRTDFEKTSRARKPVCSFSIELTGGRLNTLSQSAPAKNLLEVLMQDDITRALLRKNHYAFSLNSDFQLTIKNTTPPAEATENDEVQKDAESTGSEEGEVHPEEESGKPR